MDSLFNDLTGLFDRDHTDDLVVIAIAVPIVGLILLATHRRRLWRVALAMQAVLCGWLVTQSLDELLTRPSAPTRARNAR